MNSRHPLTVLFALLGAMFLSSSDVDGAKQNFPYEARVDANDVYVRSGPGNRYYPTQRLDAGASVMVHRHDPGGWYMITPPEGSFSWIRAQYIQQQGENKGVLTENQVIVRVGSNLGDARDVEQRRLSKGDEVEIVGEKTFTTERGPLQMLKILPPKGEYRWVPGQFITPLNRIAKQQKENDPYAFPPSVAERNPQRSALESGVQKQNNTQRVVENNSSPVPSPLDPLESTRPQTQNQLVERPVISLSAKDIERQAMPKIDELVASRMQLKAIDTRYRDMLLSDAGNWDLDSIEKDYAMLKELSDEPMMVSNINVRLQSLEKYRGIKREYDDFVRLTKETDQRDAQLLRMQHGARITGLEPIPDSSNQQTELQPEPLVTNSGEQPIFNAEPIAPDPGSIEHAFPPSDEQDLPLPLKSPVIESAEDDPFGDVVESPADTELQFDVPVPEPDKASVESVPIKQHPESIQESVPVPTELPTQTQLDETVQAPAPQPTNPEPLSNAPQQPAPATQSTPAPPATQTLPRFDGAGIVTRTPFGMFGRPRYVLVAPTGQLLAYLHPTTPGVNLEAFVGQPAGVLGQRFFQPFLGADVIHVHGIQPVRLRIRR